jgi:predicted PurR-regulated permease PerM
MRRTVGLSPVIIIVGILIGARLAGILGILLSVPIVAGIFVVLREWKNAQNPSQES